MNKPFVVGLTGGIGSGKSLVSKAFSEFDIDIIDADKIARDVVLPGSEALDEIADYFGPDFISTDGSLNRIKMREFVFDNPDAKAWLNQCLHPKIRKQMHKEISRSKPPYCVLDVPLLFENKMQDNVDIIVVVDCKESQQLERAVARDGSEIETIKQIMSAQVSRDVRLRGADIVVDNSGSIEDTLSQVSQVHRQILAKTLTNP